MTLLEEAKDLCNIGAVRKLGEAFWKKEQYQLFQTIPTLREIAVCEECFVSGFSSALDTRLMVRLIERIEELEAKLQ